MVSNADCVGEPSRHISLDNIINVAASGDIRGLKETWRYDLAEKESQPIDVQMRF